MRERDRIDAGDAPLPSVLDGAGDTTGTGTPRDVLDALTRAPRAEDELHYYLRVLYGRRWLIAAAALLGLVIAAVRTFREPRLYVAQSTIEFKQAIPPGKDLDIMQRQLFIPAELAARLLTTKMLAARVIKMQSERGDHWFDGAAPAPESGSLLTAVGALVRQGFALVGATARSLFGTGPPELQVASKTAIEESPVALDGVSFGAIGSYYGHISIAPVHMTSIVDIVVTHPDPLIAARIANDHAQAFVEMDVETKAASLSDAQGLFMHQLQEVRKELDASRKALSDYQVEHGLLSLPKDMTTLSRQSAEQLNKMLVEAEGTRISAEAAYRRAAASSPEQLAGTLDDRGLQAIRDQILSLRAKYTAQSQEYGPNHPDMMALRARIDSLQGNLREATAQTRELLKASYEAARAKEQDLRRNFTERSRNASQEERGLVQLVVLQRDLDSNERLYSTLLEQAKQADLVSGSFQWTNVNQLDRAVAPSIPSFPQTRRNLTLGLLFGLAVGMMAALLMERLDRTVHTPEDLTDNFDLPTLGVVPNFRLVSEKGAYRSYGAYGAYRRRRSKPAPAVEGVKTELVTLANPASVFSEAYRTIRTNLMFSRPAQPPRTVLITSSQPGEGKTITVVNLAVSLALSGSRVLIVDADMRCPTCHSFFRLPKEPGLSNFLSGQCELATAIVKAPILEERADNGNGFGLYVLPGGRIPPNPAELLSAEVMSRLLDTVEQQYDFVLIDSPPVNAVTDSVVIATKADSVLFVIREGEWNRDLIRKALVQLRTVRARTLGAILNRVDFGRVGKSDYYYRRYHGYGSYQQYYGKSDDAGQQSQAS